MPSEWLFYGVLRRSLEFRSLELSQVTVHKVRVHAVQQAYIDTVSQYSGMSILVSLSNNHDWSLGGKYGVKKLAFHVLPTSELGLEDATKAPEGETGGTRRFQ